jgi:hypothetical protein
MDNTMALALVYAEEGVRRKLLEAMVQELTAKNEELSARLADLEKTDGKTVKRK